MNRRQKKLRKKFKNAFQKTVAKKSYFNVQKELPGWYIGFMKKTTKRYRLALLKKYNAHRKEKRVMKLQ